MHHPTAHFLDVSLAAGLRRKSHPVFFSQKLATETQLESAYTLETVYRERVSSDIYRTLTAL